MRKVCTECGVEKDVSEYHKYKKNRGGLKHWCKGCCKVYSKKHRTENKDKILEQQKKYRNENREKLREGYTKHYYRNRDKILESQKKDRIKNKEKHSKKAKKYRIKNRGEIIERRKKHYAKNKQKIRARNEKWATENRVWVREYRKKYQIENREARREYTRKRLLNDMNFKLALTLRTRIRTAIKKGYKNTSSMELLGCTIEELKNHLESQFQLFMNWDNHGMYGWHMDHIVPIAKFDLTDPEQQKLCFHYTNLQPLWAKDNLRKHDKLEWEMTNV